MGGGVLVDSGTTLIYLPSTVSQAIETEIEKSVPDLKTTFFEWSTCVTESELDSFPDLTIGFANGDCSAYGGDSYSDDDSTSKMASMEAVAAVDLATRPESVFIGAIVLVAGVVGMFSFRSRFSYAAVPEESSAI